MNNYFFQILNICVVFLAFFLSVFLYWRQGKRELIENRILFDVVAVFLAGAFVFGRLSDFVVRSDYYNWSFERIIFFNTYWGFDKLGAFFGGTLFTWAYLFKKRENFWEIFDFAAGPIAFGISLFLAWRAILELLESMKLSYFLLTCSYFLIFWMIKRLEKQKKFKGFFACFLLVTSSLVNLSYLMLVNKFNFKNNIWEITVTTFVFIASCLMFYMRSRRKPLSDIKSLFGAVLLSLFKAKRVLTSLREADNSSKAIVLSPFYLAKGVYFLVKYVGREIRLSFIDLVRAFGVGK